MTKSKNTITDELFERELTAALGRRILKYKLIRGNSLDDLEKVTNIFLALPTSANYSIHGDIQMYSHQEWVQTLVGSEITND